MSETAGITIAGLAVSTFAIKAFGPVFFGGRELPEILSRIIPLVAPALFAGLIAVDTFGVPGPSLTIDARAGGLAAAAVAIRFKAPIVLVVVSAVAVTALIRAVT
jgi:branched-subunit amino acid transport protein